MITKSGRLIQWWHRTHSPVPNRLPSRPIHPQVEARNREFYAHVETGRINEHLTSSVLKAATQVEVLAQARLDTDKIAAIETSVMPAVKKRLPYLEYRRTDNPLTMLYGACIASIETFGRLPDALFVSSIVLPLLDVQSRKATGMQWQGHFQFPTTQAMDGKIKHIPVFTEELLPDAIMAEMKHGLISRESVIVLCEV